MKVISVLNQKGGSGKTTIATHIASLIHNKGNSVILVDSDPQGSARDGSVALRNSKPVFQLGLSISQPKSKR